MSLCPHGKCALSSAWLRSAHVLYLKYERGPVCIYFPLVLDSLEEADQRNGGSYNGQGSFNSQDLANLANAFSMSQVDHPPFLK